jgi:hypothetical protein
MMVTTTGTLSSVPLSAAIEVKSGNAARKADQLAKDSAMETEVAEIGNNGGALAGRTMKLKTIEVRPF